MGMPLKREVPVTAAIASALVADEALQAPAQRLAAGVGHQLARLFPGKLTTSRARSKPIG